MANWSNRYKYNESNVDEYVPEEGGVYRLIYKRGDKYYVFYIGQSENLWRRLKEHLDPNEPDECIKRHIREYDCYFRFAKISSQQERNNLERSEIAQYRPRCNNRL